MLNAQKTFSRPRGVNWTTPVLARAMSSAIFRSIIVFGVLTGAIILALSSAASSMAAQWFSSSLYHHGLAAAPLAAWMIARRGDWRGATPGADWLGLPVIAVAAALWLAGRAANIDLVQHVAVVVALIGAFLAAFGRDLARASAFPLAFLFFMVPFGEELTPLLQDVAARVVGVMLASSGFDVTREGIMLTTLAGRFEMEPSCAGLRFLLAAAMISTLVSALSFRSMKKRALFIGGALAAALAANWLRAYLIVAAATLSERRIGLGPEHVAFGWVFYSALIIAMIALAHRLEDAQAPLPAVTTRRGDTFGGVILASIALLGLALAYDGLVIARAPAGGIGPLRQLTVEGYSPAPLTSQWRAHAPGADRIAVREFRAARGDIVVIEAAFSAERPGAEIAGAQTRAADGQTFRRIALKSRRMEIAGAMKTVHIETIEDERGQKLNVAALYRVGDRLLASPAVLKAEIAARRLTARDGGGAAIFIAAADDADLAAFLAAIKIADD